MAAVGGKQLDERRHYSQKYDDATMIEFMVKYSNQHGSIPKVAQFSKYGYCINVTRIKRLYELYYDNFEYYDEKYKDSEDLDEKPPVPKTEKPQPRAKQRSQSSSSKKVRSKSSPVSKNKSPKRKSQKSSTTRKRRVSKQSENKSKKRKKEKEGSEEPEQMEEGEEWFGPEIGEDVMVMWYNQMFKAKVLEKRDKEDMESEYDVQYKIHYYGFKKRHDEWVDFLGPRIFACKKHNLELAEDLKNDVEKSQNRKVLMKAHEKKLKIVAKNLNLQFSENLKKHHKSYQKEMENNMCPKLPFTPSVNRILADYMDHVEKGGEWESYGKAGCVILKIREQFKTLFSKKCAFFRSEYSQYKAVVEESHEPIDVYGLPQLIRFMYETPNLFIAQGKAMKPKYIQEEMGVEFNKLLAYLDTICDEEYEYFDHGDKRFKSHGFNSRLIDRVPRLTRVGVTDKVQEMLIKKVESME